MTTNSSAKRYRRARTIRSGLTLLMLVGLLSGAAWFGWQEILSEPGPSTTVTCTTPPPETKQEVAASDVTVNVYNAGRISGLADETARQLEDRGFLIGTVANAPEEAANVTNVRLYGRLEGAPEVQLLAAHVAENAGRVADDREEPVVDLVIGNEFEGLVKDAPKSLKVESGAPICTTTTPTPPGES